LTPGRSVLAGDGATGGTLGLLELTMPPGRWVPAHLHRAAAEAWYVLEGELTFRFGDRTAAAPAGTFVFGPPGVAHAFGNAGERPARFLELFVPGGGEGYHLERAALERARPPAPAGQYSSLDEETLTALARKYDVEFL
jgi:mannose-6-phosphate isomerase-like protein (cupin superfamily)